jgi:hypothetical protein
MMPSLSIAPTQAPIVPTTPPPTTQSPTLPITPTTSPTPIPLQCEIAVNLALCEEVAAEQEFIPGCNCYVSVNTKKIHSHHEQRLTYPDLSSAPPFVDARTIAMENFLDVVPMVSQMNVNKIVLES